MSIIKVDERLDCKGMSCPLPVVKTKKAMEKLNPGQVLEVDATDRGSLTDLRSWASRTGHHYLGNKNEGGVYMHFIRKANPQETREEVSFSGVISNDELQEKITQNSNIVLIDVREPAEYMFGHIPEAVSIPLGDLEGRMRELSKDEEIYVICRSGNRSDIACQLLAEKGFTRIKNVVPGMSGWTGPIIND